MVEGEEEEGRRRREGSLFFSCVSVCLSYCSLMNREQEAIKTTNLYSTVILVTAEQGAPVEGLGGGGGGGGGG